MPARAAIRAHILENFLFTKSESALDDAASFLEEGIVDSTGVLELVMFAEETFGISVEDEDIIPENFDSVEGLVHYVQGKTKTGEAVPDARPSLP